MKKLLTATILLVLIIIIGKIVFTKYNGKPSVCFKNHCFYVELAMEPDQRALGLMFRQNLPQNQGMLFIFKKEGEYPFWMKNTHIPLDIIWINEKKEVVFISENSQPCQQDICPTINPAIFAKYILEINAGQVKNIGLTTGSKTDINIK